MNETNEEQKLINKIEQLKEEIKEKEEILSSLIKELSK